MRAQIYLLPFYSFALSFIRILSPALAPPPPPAENSPTSRPADPTVTFLTGTAAYVTIKPSTVTKVGKFNVGTVLGLADVCEFKFWQLTQKHPLSRFPSSPRPSPESGAAFRVPCLQPPLIWNVPTASLCHHGVDISGE